MPDKIIQKTVTFEIPYEEYPFQNREAWGRDSASMTRLLVVDWADKALFPQAVLGFSQNVGGFISRTIPERHPEDQDLWAVSCDLQTQEGQTSQDVATGMAQAERAGFLVTYRRLPWRVKKDDEVDKESDRYVQRSVKFAFEMQKIPDTGQWVYDDGSTCDEVGAMPIFFRQFIYFIPDVPSELVPDFSSLANRVNSTTFDDSMLLGEIQSAGYAAEHVLFNGVDAFEHFATDGTVVVDLTYSLGARENSWNQFLDRDGVFQGVHKNGDATVKPFKTANLNALFQFEE